MARHFAGADRITFGPGTYVGTGAFTLATIFKKDLLGVWECLASWNNSREFSINNSNQPYFYNNGTAVNPTFTFPTNYVLYACCKAAGTVTMTFYKYDYLTGTLTTETPAGTVGSPTTPAAIGVGQKIGGGDPLTGDIAAMGWWDRQLAADEVQALAFTLQAWFWTVPQILWLLDQDTTTQLVNDLTGGGANQTALTATSVTAASVPVFNYDNGALLPAYGTRLSGQVINIASALYVGTDAASKAYVGPTQVWP